MKTTWLLLLALAGCDAVADDSLNQAAVIRPPPPQFIFLNVDSVDPAQPIEDRPVYVHFTLTNQTSQPRSGTVSADVDTGDPFQPTMTSSTWTTEVVAAGGQTTGVVEFAPWFAGTVTYRLHYYENGVARESNAPGASLSAALRAEFNYFSLNVEDAADSTFGDRVTGFFNVSRNGTAVSNWQLSLGVMHEWDPLESTCRHASLSIL